MTHLNRSTATAVPAAAAVEFAARLPQAEVAWEEFPALFEMDPVAFGAFSSETWHSSCTTRLLARLACQDKDLSETGNRTSLPTGP